MRHGLRVAHALGASVLLCSVLLRAAAGAGPDESAQQLFREGVDAARQERWVDARVAFEKAYGLSARPVVLINLAGAQARTGRLVEAVRNYRRILDEQSSAETSAFRSAAAETLPALEARIPRIRLRPSDLVDADVVEIDGETIPSPRLGDAQLLDPGPHTLVVRRSGLERARITFSLAERESHDLSLPIAVPPALVTGGPDPQAPQAEASLVASSRSTAERSPRPWWRSPRTWITAAGVTVAAAVLTIFLVERRDQLYSGNVPPGITSVR